MVMLVLPRCGGTCFLYITVGGLEGWTWCGGRVFDALAGDPAVIHPWVQLLPFSLGWLQPWYSHAFTILFHFGCTYFAFSIMRKFHTNSVNVWHIFDSSKFNSSWFDNFQEITGILLVDSVLAITC